jgi:cold shock CspA family protein
MDIPTERNSMTGTMLWFNVDKGYGIITTESDEKLQVVESGFSPGHKAEPRCKGKPVIFEREGEGEDARAVNVEFLPDPDPRRARMRHGRGGRSF